MICLLLAGAIETASEYSDQKFRMHRSYKIGLHLTNDWDCLMNSANLVVLMIIYSKKQNGIALWIVKYGCPRR